MKFQIYNKTEKVTNTLKHTPNKKALLNALTFKQKWIKNIIAPHFLELLPKKIVIVREQKN